jgi:hypothetical protein
MDRFLIPSAWCSSTLPTLIFGERTVSGEQ